MKKPELLAPAGNPEKLKAAIHYGADAVYLGGKEFSLRAGSGNFSPEELREAMGFVHAHGKRAYVAANIYAHPEDIGRMPDFFRFLRRIHADGVLVADLGMAHLAREIAPELELHASTQANITNGRAARAWQDIGAKRVVLARELSLEEIRAIRAACTAELEIFVHGAMCISYSGRCYLSSYLAGRDANRGDCAQPCRWRYCLSEERRPGQAFPVEEDGRGTYVMNSRDLSLMPCLREVIESGVDSLKIEGRMKSVHYVASVTKAYRMAIDSYFESPGRFRVREEWLAELEKVSHRAYTTGFFLHPPTADDQICGSSSYERSVEFVGLVRDYDAVTGLALVEQRNRMAQGEEIEIFQPRGDSFRQILTEMRDEEGRPVAEAPHPRQLLRIPMERPVEPWTILRRTKR